MNRSLMAVERIRGEILATNMVLSGRNVIAELGSILSA